MNKTRISKALVIACALVMVVGSLAFFTDRETQSATATAGDIDLIFTDSSVNTYNADPSQTIGSNNQFCQSKVWDAGKLLNADDKVINPGDYFDMSYTLSNTGSKSIDVRQKLVVTSSEPMTVGKEEYQLTVIQVDGASAIKASVAETADGKTTYTYDLKDIILNGSKETETGASNGVYTVRLDFSKEALNAFMDSDVTVNLYATAKQHRNTTETDFPAYSELANITNGAAAETIGTKVIEKIA